MIPDLLTFSSNLLTFSSNLHLVITLIHERKQNQTKKTQAAQAVAPVIYSSYTAGKRIL